MGILAPNGWNTFTGGSVDPDLCGEDQTCPEPPCGDIPELRLDMAPGNLSCTASVLTGGLTVTGGVGPFTFSTDQGQIVVTGDRTADFNIDTSVNFSNVIDIGGTSNDPCKLPAYIYRGRAIFANSTGDIPLSIACDKDTCSSIAFNCHGQQIGSALDLNNGTNPCDASIEDLAVAGMSNPAALQGYGMDYSNCTRYPDGWPLLCVFTGIGVGTIPPSWECAVDPTAACPNVDFVTKDFSGPGVCDAGANVNNNDPGGGSAIGITPQGYLTEHPASGSLCDVRHPALLAEGCAPCVVIADTDIPITVTDALGNQAVAVIHINP